MVLSPVAGRHDPVAALAREGSPLLATEQSRPVAQPVQAKCCGLMRAKRRLFRPQTTPQGSRNRKDARGYWQNGDCFPLAVVAAQLVFGRLSLAEIERRPMSCPPSPRCITRRQAATS